MMSRNRYAAVLWPIVAIALVIAGLPLHAAVQRPPEGFAMYIMVLHVPGLSPPGNGKIPDKVVRPDVAKHGGRILETHDNKSVIHLPPGKAKALRRDENVAYLQRVWTGESFESWNETEEAHAGLTAQGDSDPPTWDTGTFQYDSSGNIKTIGSDQYAYDSAARIIDATVNGKQETYAYDSFGNLTLRAPQGETAQPIAVDASSNRLANEEYDAAGNITTERSTRAEYHYDSTGMIDAMRTPEGQLRRMIYTADDERLGTIVANDKVRWRIRDFNGKVLREYASSSTDAWEWYRDYYYAAGTLVAGDREPYFGGRRHMHVDHLGSVRLVTNVARTSYGRHDYLPFGLEATSPTQEHRNFLYYPPEPMKFTSHERDYNGAWNVDNTEYLDYMHARYYNPAWGRFLSVDPVLQIRRAMRHPQMWNRYAYVANNPLKYVDPTGKVLELTGNDDERKKTLAALRNSVPVEMRMFVRTTTTKDGKTILDSRYLNMGRESSSGNFQTLRTISNSSGLVAANTSATSGTFRNGETVPLTRGGVAGLTIESRANVERGTTSVLVAGNLPAQETSSTLAHELRHSMLYLLGKSWTHEPGFHETSPGVFNMWDPNGPVNRSTAAAEAEADRNFDPFYRHDQ